MLRLHPFRGLLRPSACVCVGERRWAQQASLKGVLCHPLEMIRHFWSHYPTTCYLMLHCLWLLGCALSPISPVSRCSAQSGLLNATMPYEQHNTLHFICHYKRGEELKNQCPGGYGKRILIHALHQSRPSVFSLVELVALSYMLLLSLFIFSLSHPQYIFYVPRHIPYSS